MKELYDAWKQVDRNKVAALLSVFPGLGHLYKHHYMAGAGILTAGNVLMVFVALWLAFATVGLSLVIVPALWFVGIACSAYYATDEHGKHPYLHISNLRHAKASVPVTRS